MLLVLRSILPLGVASDSLLQLVHCQAFIYNVYLKVKNRYSSCSFGSLSEGIVNKKNKLYITKGIRDAVRSSFFGCTYLYWVYRRIKPKHSEAQNPKRSPEQNMTATFYKSSNISVLVWVPYALFLKNLEIKAANRFAKRGIPDNSCLNALKHN